MALTVLRKLPEASETSERYPVLPAHRIQERRAEIQNILDGSDPRRLAIVGPCSAWPFDAVRRYADKLTRLQEELHENLFFIMRCYIQKPRTTVGWPGPLNQPDPKEPVNICEGIERCSTMIHAVAQQLPLADEMLFTHNEGYFDGKLSYLAVGARSGEDMEHRYIASGAEMPVGVKNTTGGDIAVGVNGVLSVQTPHEFAFRRQHVRSTGNPYAHLILRGGNGRSNYDPKSIAEANKQMDNLGIKNPAIIVDASHDNAQNGHGKDPGLQAVVIDSVLSGIRRRRKEFDRVRGFMIESFLLNGKQPDSAAELTMDGLSITDPCLGWEGTEQLLRETADFLNRYSS